MRWGHINPIKKDGEIICAKIIVYAGDDDEYFSFITPEAYYHLENWINYRKECGETIDDDSWVMRQLWNTKEGHYHHGTIKQGAKLQSSGVKRLMEDSLWTQGIRKKSNLIRNRYEFQTDHGLRKWFKTRCELAGMKSINIEILMGHSIGISDSYYRVTENELLQDYLKIVDSLTISKESKLDKQINKVIEQATTETNLINSELYNKNQEILCLNERNSSNSDAIAALSDQVMKLEKEMKSKKHSEDLCYCIIRTRTKIRTLLKNSEKLLRRTRCYAEKTSSRVIILLICYQELGKLSLKM